MSELTAAAGAKGVAMGLLCYMHNDMMIKA